MFYYKLDNYLIMISGFMIIIMVGVMWINSERKIFCGVSIDGIMLFLLWMIFTNIINENVAAISDIMKIMMIVLLFHKISLDIIIISLMVLIVGGAEMFRAININHQKVIFGIIVIRPLNKRMFRVWYLIYKSFTRRNNADEDNPWAIIIMIAPVNPI